MLTAVSLFAGVGGIDLALERAGVDVKAAVEIDEAARGVLADQFPKTVLFNDVTEVTGDDLRRTGFVPKRGILTAGWPCQGNSVAGARGGMADPRSGLWRHVVRLLAETRPRWFIGENVPGLLSVNGGDDIAVVRADLAQLGYWWAERVLDAQHFGVPQRRRRIVFVGHLGDQRGPVEVLLEPEGRARDSATRVSAWPDIAPTLEAGANRTGGTRPPGSTVDTAESLIVSTLQAGATVDTGSTSKRQQADTSSSRGVVMALTGSGVGTCGPDDNQAQAGHLVTHTHTFQKVIRSGERDVNGDLPPEVWAEREVAATLNLHDLGSDTRAVELVVQPTTATGSVAHALTAEGHDASEDGSGRGTPIIAATLTSGGHPNSNAPGRRQEDDVNLVAFQPQAAGDSALSIDVTSPCLNKSQLAGIVDARELETTVRRLTPMECERLQGFPDGHTLTSNGKPQADSQRYKQMGNAVAVPVFEWVAQRIVAFEERES